MLAGLSGGADSAFLLSVLSELRRDISFNLYSMHVHHGIRFKEADRDESWSREFSNALQVPFSVCHVDAPSYAREKGLGLEEAARLLRYRAFSEELNRIKAAYDENNCLEDGLRGRYVIAVAHHQDDQAETILHNLFRGSGLKGMRGMESRRGDIIRPLLGISKAEILSDLEQHKINFMQDSTNSDIRYARNRIRAKIIPEAKEVNAAAVRHIAQMAEVIGEADAILQEIANAYVREKVSFSAEGAAVEASLDIPELRSRKPLLRRYILMEILQEMKIPQKDWGSVHYNALDGILFRQGGSHLDLPYKLTADVRKKRLVLSIQTEVLSMKRRRRHEGTGQNADFRGGD